MDKIIRIVVTGLFFPVTMMQYFLNALKRLDNIELVTVGPFTENWIPWNGGMKLSRKYVNCPTIPLPYPPQPQTFSRVIESLLPEKWIPDLWLQFDAGFHLLGKPKNGINALICTDPHVISWIYKEARPFMDKIFSMQKVYAEPTDIYLPYAVDTYLYYPEGLEKKYDACLIGLPYDQRTKLVNALRAEGFTVYYEIGKVFDEFRDVYNQSRVALNWSSKDDLNARTFEAFGMKIPLVTNRVTDMSLHFQEDVHYKGFSDISEAVQKVKFCLANPEIAKVMAENAYQEVIAKHTYDIRVQQILKECGLL